MSHPSHDPHTPQDLPYGVTPGVNPAGGPPTYGQPYPSQPYGAPGHPGYPGGPGGAPTPGQDQTDRSLAVLAHLSTLIATVLSAGSLAFVGPLVMWFVYKDRHPFVRQAAAGAFNFALGLSVMSIVGWALVLTFIGAIVGGPLIVVAMIAQVVVPIIAAVRANRGEPYRYPFAIPALS